MSVQATVTSEWNMRRVAVKYVPSLLSIEQKKHRIEVCQDVLQCAVDDPTFMSRIISSDES